MAAGTRTREPDQALGGRELSSIATRQASQDIHHQRVTESLKHRNRHEESEERLVISAL
jgi:hypothetical protein